MASGRAMRALLILCLLGAAFVGSASAVPKYLEPQHNGEGSGTDSKEETDHQTDYWKSLSEEEVESVLADDDGFDTKVFSTVLEAIQQDKLKGQAAFEEVARNAFHDGLIRIGRKINGQGIKPLVPSTDAEAALLAKSSGKPAPQSPSELSRDSMQAVEVKMHVVVGRLQMQMPWINVWSHVKQAVGSLWSGPGHVPVAGPRRHSIAKRHAVVATPSASQEIEEQVEMLTRSGFADEGDALLDMLRQFDSGDGESEELMPQHSDEASTGHQVNRKVKISVVHIPPPKRAGPVAPLLQRLRHHASSGCAAVVTGFLVLIFAVSGTVLVLSALQASHEGEPCDCCSQRSTVGKAQPQDTEVEVDSEPDIKRVVTYTLHQ